MLLYERVRNTHDCDVKAPASVGQRCILQHCCLRVPERAHLPTQGWLIQCIWRQRHVWEHVV